MRVETEFGPVIGNEVDVEGDGELSDTIYTYYGIPFAKPPVGDLRFAVRCRSQRWNKLASTRYDK